MHQKTIKIGRLFGIPIEIDYSWFYMFFLVVWLLADEYYPAHYHDWLPVMYWVMGTITSLLFFFSVLLHELGHSLVARYFGIPVDDIVLLIFGGISKIRRNPQTPAQEFWIVLAGPLVNILLWALLMLAASMVRSYETVYALFTYLAYINLILGIFNLIPGYPLDGGKALLAIIWAANHDLLKAIIIAANVGRLFAYLFIFLGLFLIFAGNIWDGLWLAFIGWFLESAAATQVHKE